MIREDRAFSYGENKINYNNKYEIISQHKIADNVFEMKLKKPLDYDNPIILKPGQFANIKLDGYFLRRPISICDWTDDTITLIYKVVGEGTDMMSYLTKGKVLDIISGLGNGFSLKDDIKQPLLIGGGVGIPPLYALAKHVISKNENLKDVSVVLGFNTKEEVFYLEEFKKLGLNVHLTTLDGSLGNFGFVTDFVANNNIPFDYFYSCGPLAMLRAVTELFDTDGQISMEERMGCGFGACMGCSIETKNGSKRVCKEGPVFEKEELIWNTI